ncbi:hypothetical protein B0H34DRAFT_705518, partial [Crassisporium funariophilum]
MKLFATTIAITLTGLASQAFAIPDSQPSVTSLHCSSPGAIELVALQGIGAVVLSSRCWGQPLLLEGMFLVLDLTHFLQSSFKIVAVFPEKEAYALC